MSNKIVEVQVEPSRVETGSTSKLKIRAIRYATYNEVKTKLTYTTLADYTYGELKGE